MTKAKKPLTRADFLDAYRVLLRENMMWAKEEAKLDRFMRVVEDTLTNGNPQTRWLSDGSLTRRAYNSIGGVGKPTLAKLKGLP